MKLSGRVVADVFTGCGEQLRQARNAAGLSIETVSNRSKMPVRVIQAIEDENWDTLGAEVFIRGQLRSYARLLDVDLDPQLQQGGHVAATTLPPLVSHAHTPPLRRMVEQLGRRAVYIALTVVIVAPVIFASRSHLGGGGSSSTVKSLDNYPVPAQPVAEKSAPAAAQRTPVIASMASIIPPAATAAPALELVFSGDSWVQVYAPDGSTLEKGLLASGERRRYESGQVGRVVLGNSSAAQVIQDGKPVDLTAFSRANVARFTLSSDGSLAPVVD